MKKHLAFIALTLLVSLFMEIVGSYISVVGLSSLFAADIVIIIMAIVFDVAKITAVSFLYQYWTEINRLMKYYLTVSVAVLMLITSAGAFGYLSAAFQRAVQPNTEILLKVDKLTKQQAELEKEKQELTTLKLSINKQIADIPTENERSRRQLIVSMKPELERTNKRLDDVNKQLDVIREQTLFAKTENVEKEVHTGPITYVSKAFNIPIEDASKYIILIIVLVFDPLAIMLILAANFLIKYHGDREQKSTIESTTKAELPIDEKVDTVITSESESDVLSSTIENNERTKVQIPVTLEKQSVVISGSPHNR